MSDAENELPRLEEVGDEDDESIDGNDVGVDEGEDDDEGDDGYDDVDEDDDDDDSVSAELELLHEQDIDDPEDIKPPENITFDVNLPAEHSYLGTDFEELHGRTILEEEEYLSLPILTLPGVVLIPGQTIPLQLFQAQMISMIKHVCEKDKTFGVITARDTDAGPVLAFVGTTAEIHSIKEESDEPSGISTMRVKAMGRQRFEVIETQRQVTGILVAKVRILPERMLPEVLEGAGLQTHKKLHFGWKNQVPSPSACGDNNARKNRRKVDRFSCANWTWWPPWVYKLYDQHLLVNEVKEELRGWNLGITLHRMPGDPIQFSYWVAGNLPFDDTMKLALLQLDSAVQRLRCELGILKKCSILCCRACRQEVTGKEDVFSLALSGPMAAYVNPGGHIHETLTVYKAQGLTLIGRPSAEYSWFPGYSWTIANCRRCGSHKGWRFTANEKHLQPSNFWGLTRSGLQPGYEPGEGGPNWEPSL